MKLTRLCSHATTRRCAPLSPRALDSCMDSEFYTGWLTHWSEKMANTSTATVAKWTKAAVESGASISFYMAHGGTNFGFWSGANGDGARSYLSHITSYDYDSPISEGGEHGYGSDGADKFQAIKEALAAAKLAPSSPPPPEPPLPPRRAFADVVLEFSSPMLSDAALAVLAPPAQQQRSDIPLSMEVFGQRHGFILYEATTPACAAPSLAFSSFPRDRAHVFVNGSVATAAPFYRTDAAGTAQALAGASPAGGQRLSLLVRLLCLCCVIVWTSRTWTHAPNPSGPISISSKTWEDSTLVGG